jgi:DNA repair protein RecN (Recombination protein N)
MLSEIRIRNFALIDQLSVRLGPGLNVLTGETGAGKSIVVGALSLLLGERASSDVVRAGTDRATVEGVFEITEDSELLAWIDEHGFEAPDGLLVVKREVAAEGRSRAWINGTPATAGLLAELGGMLVALHGQHQQQLLLRRDAQRQILDAFGGLLELAGQVAMAHRTVSEYDARIAEVAERRRNALQRADFLRFQVAEIESASLEPGEEERLDAEGRRLSHAEELIELVGSLVGILTSDGGGAAERLGAARRGIDRLVSIDPDRHELSELFDTAWYAVEELGSRLQDYLRTIEHDPARLDEIRTRQDILYRLRAKYGPTLPDVLETLHAAREELARIDNSEWELAELTRGRDAANAQLAALADELSESRLAAAGAVESEVNRILPDLGMANGIFRAVVTPMDTIGRHGKDGVEFLVALNAGFEPRPLSQVASGGELSRVMLALKAILARVDFVPTLIFDEVDAGIGGRVALRVGDTLRRVADNHQVLAITHLPQIAARAHRHLLVSKSDGEGPTTTSVRALDEAERADELARMLGGDPESPASLAHARELLRKGREPAAVAPATD